MTGWTGGTDMGREGHWYWAGSLATVGDFMWYPNQPDSGIQENCLWLDNNSSYDFLGNDLDCIGNIKYFICQKR